MLLAELVNLNIDSDSLQTVQVLFRVGV